MSGTFQYTFDVNTIKNFEVEKHYLTVICATNLDRYNRHFQEFRGN